MSPGSLCSQQFVASGNINYFVCTNKGCDVNQPIALTLGQPGVIPSPYKGVIPVMIPQPQKTVCVCVLH
jgi:hypothetical protein